MDTTPNSHLVITNPLNGGVHSVLTAPAFAEWQGAILQNLPNLPNLETVSEQSRLVVSNWTHAAITLTLRDHIQDLFDNLQNLGRDFNIKADSQQIL